MRGASLRLTIEWIKSTGNRYSRRPLGLRDMNERLLNPISDAELDRRWTAVRKAMAEQGIDALVVQSNNDWLGGHVKWLTDHPATNGYPKTVVFHANDWMTVIDMGPRGGRRKLGGNDEIHRGVGEVLTTPAFTSVAYTDEYQAELVVSDIKRRNYRAVGITGGGARSEEHTSELQSLRH